MEKIIDKDKCCGCLACVSICPKNAINVIEDENGFKEPYIDQSKCIDCKLCVNTCPRNKFESYNSKTPKAYACYSLDEEIRKNSSSGGLFPIIARYILNNNGTVYGAAIQNNIAKHIRINSLDDLELLMGSKYVQSDTNGIYEMVKEDLKQNINVLFSGTPCQIAALYSYLNKSKVQSIETLYTIEVICHGVPSPKVLDKYLKEKQNEYSSSIKKINFRDKHYGWKNFSFSIKFENGDKYIQSLSKDIYMQAFLKNVCLRKSCYNCTFSSLPRTADITLGDYWGVQYKYSHLSDDKGISLMLVNNEKGNNLIESIKNDIYIEPTDLNFGIEHNPCIIKPVKEHENREIFFNELDNMTFKELQNKYFKPLKENILHRGIRKFKRILSSLKKKVMHKDKI